MWKDAFQSSLETMDFGKISMRQGFVPNLLCDTATGYRVWRDLPHTPITSLVKYPPPEVLFHFFHKFTNMRPDRHVKVTFF